MMVPVPVPARSQGSREAESGISARVAGAVLEDVAALELGKPGTGEPVE
jgi:hypothetical protein